MQYDVNVHRNLFLDAYDSFKLRVSDLGNLGVPFTHADKNSLLLSLELLTASRLTMQQTVRMELSKPKD